MLRHFNVIKPLCILVFFLFLFFCFFWGGATVRPVKKQQPKMQKKKSSIIQLHLLIQQILKPSPSTKPDVQANFLNR